MKAKKEKVIYIPVAGFKMGRPMVTGSPLKPTGVIGIPANLKSVCDKFPEIKEEVIELMIWAEENGKDFTGKDIEGRKKQFENKINL